MTIPERYRDAFIDPLTGKPRTAAERLTYYEQQAAAKADVQAEVDRQVAEASAGEHWSHKALRFAEDLPDYAPHLKAQKRERVRLAKAEVAKHEAEAAAEAKQAALKNNRSVVLAREFFSTLKTATPGFDPQTVARLDAILSADWPDAQSCADAFWGVANEASERGRAETESKLRAERDQHATMTHEAEIRLVQAETAAKQAELLDVQIKDHQ